MRLCLSGKTITFGSEGKLVIDSSNGSLYICNCKDEQASIRGNYADTIIRKASANCAIEINSTGDCYIFGKRGLTTKNITIENFINFDGSTTTYESMSNEGRNSGFIHIGRYANLDDDGNITGYTEPAGRMVVVCDVEVSNCSGLTGGFMWAEYVNSFMSCGVDIENCRAGKGPAYAIDYYQDPNSPSGNEFLLFLEVLAMVKFGVY